MAKIMAERSAMVRAALRAGVLSDGPKMFYALFKRFTLEEKVPPQNRLSALRYLAELVRARGVEVDTSDLDTLDAAQEKPARVELGAPPSSDYALTPSVDERDVVAIKQLAEDGMGNPVTPKETGPADVSASPSDEDDEFRQILEGAFAEEYTNDLAEANFGFSPENEPDSDSKESPLTEAVRRVKDKWLAEKKTFKVLWMPFRFQGQDFYLLSTWRMHMRTEKKGFLWNFTGTTGNGNPVLHRCGSDIRYHENGLPVCVTEDITGMEWDIPKSKDFQRSTLAGTKQVVNATAFVWVLNFVPNREFRVWLNEEGLPDLWRKRVTMAASLP